MELKRLCLFLASFTGYVASRSLPIGELELQLLVSYPSYRCSDRIC
jgi:hypothetical protein